MASEASRRLRRNSSSASSFSSSDFTEFHCARALRIQSPASRAAIGRRSGPSTTSAITASNSNSPKPKSNMARRYPSRRESAARALIGTWRSGLRWTLYPRRVGGRWFDHWLHRIGPLGGFRIVLHRLLELLHGAAEILR